MHISNILKTFGVLNLQGEPQPGMKKEVTYKKMTAVFKHNYSISCKSNIWQFRFDVDIFVYIELLICRPFETMHS